MEKKKWCLKGLERGKKKLVRKSMPVVQSKSQTIILNRLVIDCFLIGPQVHRIGLMIILGS